MSDVALSLATIDDDARCAIENGIDLHIDQLRDCIEREREVECQPNEYAIARYERELDQSLRLRERIYDAEFVMIVPRQA